MSGLLIHKPYSRKGKNEKEGHFKYIENNKYNQQETIWYGSILRIFTNGWVDKRLFTNTIAVKLYELILISWKIMLFLLEDQTYSRLLANFFMSYKVCTGLLHVSTVYLHTYLHE